MNKQIVVVLGVLAVPGLASAGGLFVPGTGPQAQGRAGAFVAKADDPSALFHNPAGFAKQTGWVIQVGVNFVDYDVTFTRDGVYEAPSGADLPYEGQAYQPISDDSKPQIGIGPFQAVPLIAVSGDVGVENLRIGFGVYAPQAFPNRDFAGDYEFQAADVPPPPQRYDIMDQHASTVFPSVAVAYRVMDNLDLGVRASWGFGEVSATSYTWGIRNYEEWVARDGLFKVDVGDNFIPAFGVGALFRVTDNLEIGAAYASAATFDGKGNGSAVLGDDLGVGGNADTIQPDNDFPLCEAGGTSQDDLRACLALKLPQTASVGARWVLRDAANNEKGDVELDVKWENWKNASDVTVIVDGVSELTSVKLNETVLRHGFKDVISVRLGGSYNVPVAGKDLGLRGGIAYDTAAAPNSWQRVDLDGAARVTLGLGASYYLNNLRLDVGGGYVFEGNREVPSCNPIVNSMEQLEGCPPGSGEAPQAERDAPDPIQPLSGPNNQTQSPFNGGTYESSYLLLTVGVTYQM